MSFQNLQKHGFGIERILGLGTVEVTILVYSPNVMGKLLKCKKCLHRIQNCL